MILKELHNDIVIMDSQREFGANTDRKETDVVLNTDVMNTNQDLIDRDEHVDIYGK